MNILVFNCGSSSLKFRLIAMPGEQELIAGEAQRVGTATAEPSRIVYKRDGKEAIKVVAMASQRVALEEVMKLLAGMEGLRPEAIGHRMVHGGSRFTEVAAFVDAAALRDLDSVAGLAPLHNPPAIAVVRTCSEVFPALPQYLIFDTAYHATIPAAASTYALPKWMRERLGFRKYGFHGTSHQYVAQEAAAFLGKPMDTLNAVSCHLGSGGASLCAIVGGRSVDNTMGYSPLQGLVMSTRSGDLDPGLVLEMMLREDGDAAKVESFLNRKSGVLGLSGASSDIRDVLRAAQGEDGPATERARLAAGVYTWRLRKYLGAYLAVVGTPDAILFTDTIGELVPEVRAAVCAGMDVFGIQVDAGLNAKAVGKALPADFAAAGSAVRLLAIHTNEELSIARCTYALAANAA